MSSEAPQCTSWLALAGGAWWLGATGVLAAGLAWPSLGLPWTVLAYCGVTAVVSGVAFVVYGVDKWLAATDGGRRVPERVLHGLDLAGGWAGGLVAQQVFRHKTQKLEFGLVFWATVLLHLGVVAWCGWSWMR